MHLKLADFGSCLLAGPERRTHITKKTMEHEMTRITASPAQVTPAKKLENEVDVALEMPLLQALLDFTLSSELVQLVSLIMQLAPRKTEEVLRERRSALKREAKTWERAFEATWSKQAAA